MDKAEVVSIGLQIPDNEDEGETFVILYEYAGKFFRVITFPPSNNDLHSDAFELSFWTRLSECSWWDGEADDEPEGFEEQMNKVYNETEDLVTSLLQPIISVHSSTQNHTVQSVDLSTYLDPEVWTFQLVFRDKQPELISRDDLPAPCFHPSIPDVTNIDAAVHRISASSIEIVERLDRPWILKVKFDNQIFFCKLTNTMFHESLVREYSALQRMANNSQLEHTRSRRVRVPELKGVIESRPGEVVGILMEYISAKSTLSELLSSDDASAISSNQKVKWGQQIRHILTILHDLDVVWGDGKTSNVLIDDKDDAWIVDFGGGQTEGWVDTDLVDTKAGDLQALAKIFKALSVQMPFSSS